MDNKQRIKCLFGYHDWERLNGRQYKMRCCKHCKKNHPEDIWIYKRIMELKRELRNLRKGK